MKNNHENPSKLGKFLSGRGFYVALCASIVTVGAAGYFTYRSTTSKLENQLDSMLSSSSSQSGQTKEWGYDDLNSSSNGAAKANVEETGVPKEKQTTAKQTQAAVTEPPQTQASATQAQAQASAPVFVMPMNGEITQEYSNGELVKSKTLKSWKTHDGVDIAGNLGDQVKSIAEGTVTSVKEDPMWGVCIVIDHGNGYEGHYYSLNKVVSVKADQKVSAGTVLGSVGNTAEAELSEPSHLHFGLKKNGQWVDPLSVIKN